MSINTYGLLNVLCGILYGSFAQQSNAPLWLIVIVGIFLGFTSRYTAAFVDNRKDS